MAEKTTISRNLDRLLTAVKIQVMIDSGCEELKNYDYPLEVQRDELLARLSGNEENRMNLCAGSKVLVDVGHHSLIECCAIDVDSAGDGWYDTVNDDDRKFLRNDGFISAKAIIRKAS